MKGTTVRLNEWENGTLKEITRLENNRRRRKGQKEIKQSEVLHTMLEKELPRYLLNVVADEADSKQTLLL